MIFVSVGSMLPFERLVRIMDKWAGKNPAWDVLIQTGATRFAPQHARHITMMPAIDFRRLVKDADLFVAHAGMGSIITAMQVGRPVLILPRHQSLGEHNTDHQIATARKMGERPGIYVAVDEADLFAKLNVMLIETRSPPEAVTEFASAELLGNVSAFVIQTSLQNLG